MQKERLKEICVRKVVISERYVRFVVLYDGFVIATFSEDELSLARQVASNLIFALYRLDVKSNYIKLYE